MAPSTVFATVGTTKFDLFISTISSPTILRVLKEKGFNNLVIQIGNGTVIPAEGFIEGVQVSYFRFKDSIAHLIEGADLVISHAGAGSCLEVLEAKKPLLVVINEDLMDNHQLELAQQLHSDGHLYYCTCKELGKTLKMSNFKQLKAFEPGNPNLFVDYLENMFGFGK